MITKTWMTRIIYKVFHNCTERLHSNVIIDWMLKSRARMIKKKRRYLCFVFVILPNSSIAMQHNLKRSDLFSVWKYHVTFYLVRDDLKSIIFVFRFVFVWRCLISTHKQSSLHDLWVQKNLGIYLCLWMNCYLDIYLRVNQGVI